jgi:hypothetical protein
MFNWRSAAGNKDDEVMEELRDIKERLGIPGEDIDGGPVYVPPGAEATQTG